MSKVFEKHWKDISGSQRSILVEVEDDGSVSVTLSDQPIYSMSYPEEMYGRVNPSEIPELIEVLQSALETGGSEG